MASAKASSQTCPEPPACVRFFATMDETASEAPRGNNMPPLPGPVEKSGAGREKDVAAGALFLAVFGLLLELAPALLVAARFRGRVRVHDGRDSGGLIAIAGLFRALPAAQRVPAARNAISLGSIGAVFMLFHGPVCVVIAIGLVRLRKAVLGW
jgi:hypothetical protein